MDDQNLTLERRLAACLEREKSKSVLRRLNIQLEAKLKAHQENEGDECPMCVLEAENEGLREWVKYSVKFLPDHIYFVNEKGHESEISKAWRKLPQDLRDALKEGE